MKVICPKCQFENQADSTRVVCARCATIIEVRVDQGSGFDANGKRQTARLPFAANSSNSGNLASGNYSSGNSGSLPGSAQNRDVYATRVGDDFDDVLDIPRPAQGEFHNTAEAAPAFEDVFSTNYDSSANYDFSAYEKKSSTPSGGFQSGNYQSGGYQSGGYQSGSFQSGGYQSDATSQRVTQDYTAPAEPEFMGWPVLPENNLDDEEELVSGTTSNRGGVITRVALVVALFGALSFLAYYFLWDYLKHRNKDQSPEIAQTQTDGKQSPQTGGGITPAPPKTEASTVPQPKNTASPAPGPERTQKNTVDIPPIPGRPLPAGPGGQSELQRPVPSLPKPPTRGNLTIQVGSYPNKEQADDRIARLRAGNIDADIEKVDLRERGIWYRVQVGGFLSRDEAAKYGNQLRTQKLVDDFIVVTKGKS